MADELVESQLRAAREGHRHVGVRIPAPGVWLRPLFLPQASHYLEVTSPNSYQHFTLPMPQGAVYVWPSTVTVTAMARHTPYGTPFVWPW